MRGMLLFAEIINERDPKLKGRKTLIYQELSSFRQSSIATEYQKKNDLLLEPDNNNNKIENKPPAEIIEKEKENPLEENNENEENRNNEEVEEQKQEEGEVRNIDDESSGLIEGGSKAINNVSDSMDEPLVKK